MAPPIRRADHVGIRVTNLDASIAFYSETLGLPVFEREVLGNGTQLVFLRMGDAGYVELVKLAQPPRPAQPVPPGQAGLQHFCMAVEDLDDWLAHLKARDVPITMGPNSFELPSARCRAVFFNDPDGTPVELIERTPK